MRASSTGTCCWRTCSHTSNVVRIRARQREVAVVRPGLAAARALRAREQHEAVVQRRRAAGRRDGDRELKRHERVEVRVRVRVLVSPKYETETGCRQRASGVEELFF